MGQLPREKDPPVQAWPSYSIWPCIPFHPVQTLQPRRQPRLSSLLWSCPALNCIHLPVIDRGQQQRSHLVWGTIGCAAKALQTLEEPTRWFRGDCNNRVAKATVAVAKCLAGLRNVGRQDGRSEICYPLPSTLLWYCGMCRGSILPGMIHWCSCGLDYTHTEYT